MKRVCVVKNSILPVAVPQKDTCDQSDKSYNPPSSMPSVYYHYFHSLATSSKDLPRLCHTNFVFQTSTSYDPDDTIQIHPCNFNFVSFWCLIFQMLHFSLDCFLSILSLVRVISLNSDGVILPKSFSIFFIWMSIISSSALRNCEDLNKMDILWVFSLFIIAYNHEIIQSLKQGNGTFNGNKKI